MPRNQSSPVWSCFLVCVLDTKYSTVSGHAYIFIPTLIPSNIQAGVNFFSAKHHTLSSVRSAGTMSKRNSEK